jgi:2'-hydroxyisoflavone reductase
MNVLILGGTQFVGRHIAEVLKERGHRVTLFNRGSNPDVHADLEQIHGDRASDLHRLGDRTWDAVVDTSAYTPVAAETSASYFGGRTQRYAFISTVSVYDLSRTDGAGEDAPLQELPEGVDRGEFNAEHYGALKALCEKVVHGAFHDRATILRPGLVAGPYDPTDRFTYWPVRFAASGEIICPLPRTPLQYIDARDLAAFAARVIELNIAGVYNCVTPNDALCFGDLYDACALATNAQPKLTRLSDDELLARGIAPWSDLPLWLPAGSEYAAMVHARSNRATVAGLKCRPLFDTVQDTFTWAMHAGKRLGSLKSGLAA